MNIHIFLLFSAIVSILRIYSYELFIYQRHYTFIMLFDCLQVILCNCRSWLNSVCKAAFFACNAGIWSPAGKQLGSKDGGNVGRVRTRFHSLDLLFHRKWNKSLFWLALPLVVCCGCLPLVKGPNTYLAPESEQPEEDPGEGRALQAWTVYHTKR